MEIITRAEARERGLTRFFTGLACRSGHISEAYTKTFKCVECNRLKSAAYRASNPEKFAGYEAARRDSRIKYTRERYWKNRDSQITSVIKWRNENRERHNATRSARQKKRYASDPRFAIELRIRGAINDALRDRGFTKRSKAAAVLGCSWAEFVVHIERQFLPGMAWANRHLWHIDHIVPLATAVTEADVLALNHFTNLRPIWAEDNLAKKDEITHLI